MPSIAELERLLAADPGDAFLLYGLAQEHAKTGNYERALEFFDRCLASDPSYLYAYFHKARSQERMGKLEAAVGTLRDGAAAARRAGDAHALSEISGYLEELTPEAG